MLPEVAATTPIIQSEKDGSMRAPACGSERGQTARLIRVCRGTSAPVTVVPRPDPLRPVSLYKAAARDVLPALWQPRVHENHVRGNVIPSTGL